MVASLRKWSYNDTILYFSYLCEMRNNEILGRIWWWKRMTLIKFLFNLFKSYPVIWWNYKNRRNTYLINYSQESSVELLWWPEENLLSPSVFIISHYKSIILRRNLSQYFFWLRNELSLSIKCIISHNKSIIPKRVLLKYFDE